MVVGQHGRNGSIVSAHRRLHYQTITHLSFRDRHVQEHVRIPHRSMVGNFVRAQRYKRPTIAFNVRHKVNSFFKNYFFYKLIINGYLLTLNYFFNYARSHEEFRYFWYLFCPFHGDIVSLF